MPYIKPDLSEYKVSDNEKFRAKLQNSKYAKFNYFVNNARFIEESKYIIINVDRGCEYNFMKYYLDVFDKEDAEHRGVASETLSPEEEEEFEELRLEKIENNKKQIELLKAKYDIDTDRAEYDWELFYKENPEIKEQPLNNVLSGARIKVKLGEGILDFMYTDFEPAIQKAAFFPVLLKKLAETIHEEDGETTEQKDKRNSDKSHTEKIYSSDYSIAKDYLRYEDTCNTTKDIIYESLYTAICPPVFPAENETIPSLNRYATYITTLQKLYLEMIEFCFDEDFFPEVLGGLYPHERYRVFNSFKDLSGESKRKEVFSSFSTTMSGKTIPYGMEPTEVATRMCASPQITPQFEEFAKKYDLELDRVAFLSKVPSFICVQYAFSTLAEILELEFTKMLEFNVRFRKCKRCGKYFIMKGNYDTNYCDRIENGETRTCKEIAALENYKAKIADNKAIPIYNKYYKRYSARVKVRQIKEADFKKWKYQAMSKRDDCTDGIITPEEFTEWMENSFPNRKPKG